MTGPRMTTAPASPAEAAGPPGITPAKWYFAVNGQGFERTLPLILAAVASARANTGLRPMCLYNGGEARHARELAALGVEVVPHRSSLEAELRAAYGESFDTFSGHWLRVDLPEIETEDEFILYTDVDVMFLAPPRVEPPPLIAAAPEFEINNTSYFNSGVMVLNLPRLREVQDEFTAAIRRRLRHGFRYPAHDQKSYNDFFGRGPLNRLRGRAFSPMSPALNWKPYWGVNEGASIVHFHGPKPRLAKRLAARGGEVATSDTYRALWRRAPDAYEAYVAMWEAHRAAGHLRRRAQGGRGLGREPA